MDSARVLGAALLAACAVACGVNGARPATSSSKGAPGSTFTITVRGETAYLDPATHTTVFLPAGGLVTAAGGLSCGISGGVASTRCTAEHPWIDPASSTSVAIVATPDAAGGFGHFAFAGACSGSDPCALRGNADTFVAVRFARTREGLGGHPNFSAAAVHGPQYRDFAAGVPGSLQCTICHGAKLQGQGLAFSCSTCHAWPRPIGQEGGVVTSEDAPGVTIVVPAGAVDASRPIAVSVATAPEAPPPDVEVVSSIYRLEPEGQVFADPVDLSLPVPPGIENSGRYGIWLEKHQGQGYEYVGGVVSQGRVNAKIPHFSDAFVGSEPAVRTIQGTRFLSYLGSANRIQNVPDVNLLGDTVQALLWDPVYGYSVYPGSAGVANGVLDGTFAIPGVPHGRVLVRIGLRFVETAENTVSLTRLLYGRPDMTEIPLGYWSSSVLGMRFDLRDLAPWQAGDELQLFSPDADTLFMGIKPSGLLEGVTSGAGSHDLRYATRFVPTHEIAGTLRGDRTFLTQMSARTSPGGVWYQALARLMPVSTFDLAPLPLGTAPELYPSFVGSMTTPVEHSIAVDWNHGAFDDAVAGACPGSTLTSGPIANSFRVLGEPNALQYGVTIRSDKRLFLRMPVPAGTREISTGTMPFGGTARTDTWGLYWTASADRHVLLQPVAYDGRSLGSFSFGCGVQVLGTMSPTVSLPAPEVTPATNITIDGASLSTPRTGVGLTPTIAWTPPATGADTYMVLIHRLFRNPDGTMDRAAVVDTTRTTFQVPPGLLVPGEAYAVTVRASKRGIDVTRPTRMNLPAAQATAVSQWFMP